MSANNGHSVPGPATTFAILTFRLANQEYGLLITNVVQIIEMVAITPLPHAPQSIPGIINYHGCLVPVIDLRRHLGLSPKAYELNTPIILIDYNEQPLGLIVDSVEEVLQISHSEITAGDAIIPVELAPGDGHPAKKKLAEVAKINHRLLLILQVERFLSQQDQTELLKGMTEYKAEEVTA